MSTIYWLAALVILIEALNKIERTEVRGKRGHALTVTLLKAAGWLLLALGSAGVVIHPLLDVVPAWMDELQHVCIAAGFAVLVVRSRMQETDQVRHVPPDEFGQTMVINRKDRP